MNPIQSWRNSFFTIYLGQAFSLLSSSAVQFSIIWWITVQTGSALALTMASVIGLLPQAIIGPFAGVWIDRFNRKAIMIIADGAVAIGSAVLFLSFFFGNGPIWLIYVVLFIRAIGETFHKPALSAAIPQLVPESELTKAGGLGQMVTSACSMVGPMLGALLMSVTTLQYAMLVDIVGAALAVMTLSFVKIPPPKRATGEKIHVINEMKQGVLAIKSNAALLKVSIPVLLSTFVFVPFGTLLPLMVKGYFGGTAWHNGVVQAIFSIGMLIAAMIIGATGGLKKQFFMISASIITLGVCSLVGGLLPPSAFWVFCIVVFIIGAMGMCFNIPYIAYIQKTIPQESMGKVISLVTSVLSLAAPVGMFIAGPLSQVIGVSNWMIGAGILLVLVGAISHVLSKGYDKKL